MEVPTEKQIQIPFPEGTFLSTAFRVKMDGPSGIVPYLDLVLDTHNRAGLETLSLAPRKILVEVKNYSLDAVSDKDMPRDMSTFGIYPDIEMTRVLKNESDLNMEKILFNLYLDLGKKSSERRLTRWQAFLNRKFGIKFPTYVTQKEIINKILFFSNWIGHQSRRSQADFVIVSPEIGSYILADPRVILEDTGASNLPSITQIASIANKIRVFVNPNMGFSDKTIVFGRITKESENGVYFCEYRRRAVKMDDYSPIDFTQRTRYQLIDQFLIDSVSENAYLNYFSTELVLGKKPILRRILGL